VHHDCFVSRDSIISAVGRRAGASFFARHRDYFVVTRNFTAVYLDLVPLHSFTVTFGFAPIYRDWQKNTPSPLLKIMNLKKVAKFKLIH
jgi:hypothetical protein